MFTFVDKSVVKAYGGVQGKFLCVCFFVFVLFSDVTQNKCQGEGVSEGKKECMLEEKGGGSVGIKC